MIWIFGLLACLVILGEVFSYGLVHKLGHGLLHSLAEMVKNRYVLLVNLWAVHAVLLSVGTKIGPVALF